MKTGSESDCHIGLAKRRSLAIAEPVPGSTKPGCQVGAARAPTVALVVAAFAEGILIAFHTAYRDRVSDSDSPDSDSPDSDSADSGSSGLNSVAAEAAAEQTFRSAVAAVQTKNPETAAGLSSLADRAAPVASETVASETVASAPVASETVAFEAAADSDIPAAGIPAAGILSGRLD